LAAAVSNPLKPANKSGEVQILSRQHISPRAAMFHFGFKREKLMPERMLCRDSACEVLELPWGRMKWSVSRDLHDSTRMSFARVTLRAGETMPKHRHPNCDEILHLLSGEIEHWVGDESFLMEPGDTLSIPAAFWHHARVLGKEDAQWVSCYSSADRKTEFFAEATPPRGREKQASAHTRKHSGTRFLKRSSKLLSPP
jgi:quercetin dioxygenase-like cupin family protein